MQRTKQEGVGYLTIAQNSGDKDYLRMAYAQALSIKLTQKQITNYSVIVDKATEAAMQDKYLKVFDKVIVLNTDDAVEQEWKLANEWKVFWLTPYQETLKVEADILFTRRIDHWLNAFRLKDICFAEGCKDYQGNPSRNRSYRTLFEELRLSDIYSGLYYFRYCKEANDFFTTAKGVFKHWDKLKLMMDLDPTTPASTDLVFAMAARMVGADACRIPTLDFISFTHMKPAHNGLPADLEWHDVLRFEQDGAQLRVNHKNQFYPFHYQSKSFNIEGVIAHYERTLGL